MLVLHDTMLTFAFIRTHHDFNTTTGCTSAASMSYATLSDALRRRILETVGPGNWAFVATVSEGFKADYLSALADITGKPVSAPDHRKTFYSAAVASVARLQEAVNNGLVVISTAEGQIFRYRVAFSAGHSLTETRCSG
jgi:hypothetical protein